MSAKGYTTVRIANERYAETADLVDDIRKNGWKTVGVERGDSPSLTTVIDEAIKLFLCRRKAKKS